MEQINQFIADNLIIIGVIIGVVVFLGKRKKESEAEEKTEKPKRDYSRITHFIKLWPETWMIPVLIAAAALTNYALMQMFPDAIFLGAEQIQTLLFKVVASFLAYFFFFVRDRLDFREAWKWYSSEQRVTEYNTLTPWQKRLTFYWRLSVFVLVFALV